MVDVLIQTVTFSVATHTAKARRLQNLLFPLPAHEKRTCLTSLLRVLSTHFVAGYPTDNLGNWWAAECKQVSGAAALLSIFAEDESCKHSLIEWLLPSTGAGIGEAIGIRRVVLLVIEQDPFAMAEVFEKTLSQFADKLWIRHTPVVRQEGGSPPLPCVISFDITIIYHAYSFPIMSIVQSIPHILLKRMFHHSLISISFSSSEHSNTPSSGRIHFPAQSYAIEEAYAFFHLSEWHLEPPQCIFAALTLLGNDSW